MKLLTMLLLIRYHMTTGKLGFVQIKKKKTKRLSPYLETE